MYLLQFADFSSVYVQSSTSWHTMHIPVREFISLSPRPDFNVAYRDEIVIARLQHCWGGGGVGKGVAYSSDSIRYYPPDAVYLVKSIMVPSDPGVPRTFVVDCNPRQKSWHTLHISVREFISSSPSPHFHVVYHFNVFHQCRVFSSFSRRRPRDSGQKTAIKLQFRNK